MLSRSTRLFLFSLFLFSFFSATIPLPADAALVPCGRSSGTAEEQAPCTACHLIVGGKGVIDYGLQIMTYIAIAVIVAMAIFYIVSSGNEGMMQTAKSGIKAALIGFAVMLAAWLIVNTTLNLIAVKDTDPNNPLFGLRQNGAFTFSCDTSSSANVAAGTPSNTPGFVSTSGATAVSVPANGTLAVPAGSSVFFPTATVVTTPAPGIITLSNGTTQSVLSGSTVTIPAGATLSFPSGATTLTLPQGGTPTLIAANSSTSTSRNNTAPATLTIVRDGEGTVTGSGISCHIDCSETYPSATSITLTATPSVGFLFASWGGACSGNSPTCSVSMTEARSVTADFIPIPPPGTFLLSVAKEGSGTGTVTATGIDCGTDCSETYTNNPTITLTATPGPNSVFTEWFGACSGTGTCSIPMTGTQKVTASFQSTLVAGGAEDVGGGSEEVCTSQSDSRVVEVDGSKLIGGFPRQRYNVDVGGTIYAFKFTTPDTNMEIVGSTNGISTTEGVAPLLVLSSCKGDYERGGKAKGCSVLSVDVSALTFTLNYSDDLAPPRRYCNLDPGKTYWIHAVPAARLDGTTNASYYFDSNYSINGATAACPPVKSNVKVINTAVSAGNYRRTDFSSSIVAAENIYAYKFTTANTADGGNWVATQLTGAPSGKLVKITQCPGVMTTANTTGRCEYATAESTRVDYVVNNPDADTRYNCHLQPNTVYYANVISKASLADTTYNCTTKTDCGFSMTGE